VNNQISLKEHEHLQRVKSLACSICDAPGPSEAHHIVQGLQYICVALCVDCHRGPILGWHGQKRAWLVRKMTPEKALNVTIKRLMEDGHGNGGSDW
jgi:hypothetical protein